MEQTKDKTHRSGGISTFDELPNLAELGCEGTIIGKAIYEGRITFKTIGELHFVLILNTQILILYAHKKESFPA